MLSPDRHPTPRPSALPLVLAGSALALALWSAADRFSWFRPSPKLEPRTITPRGALSDYERTLTEVFEENAPSVVHITTEASLRDYWGRIRSYQDGSGSGFVWDASGTIVTNDHVVAGKERVKVALLDELFDAEVIRRSPRHDLAVLRLSSVPPGLRPIPIGTSADLKVGQTAVAIGNPFGLEQTLSTGVISALDRTIATRLGTSLGGVIQIDADINPGNSGGPLLDSAGRLIGVNTAIYSPTGSSAGIGFAVPVDTVNQVVPALIAGEEFRAQLGIMGERTALPPETGYRSGVAVVELVGDTAREAGLRAFADSGTLGDVIVGIDGRRVDSTAGIRAALSDKAQGERVAIRVIRFEGARPLRFRELDLVAELN